MNIRTLLVACAVFPMLQLSAIDEWVSYEFSGGRFGDNLLAYLHAKWFAFEHNIPFLYRPFSYSEQLKMHDADHHFNNRPSPSYRTPVWRWPMQHSTALSVIYMCPYFPDNLRENTSIEQDSSFVEQKSFRIDWENPQFRRMVQELISPKHPLPLIQPPSSSVSIAMHVRQGGGYDSDDAPYKMPMKLPPIEFYIQGLQTILDLFPDQLIYCYLFTDTHVPDTLAHQILRAFPDVNRLTLDYRKSGNQHNANVLEDFFSLFEFDVLIHPLSNFSIVPARIHDYAVTLAPKTFSKDTTNHIVKIAQTDLRINQMRYQELLQK